MLRTRERLDKPSPLRISDVADCLEQLRQAFFDIADRDDIHQAAARLTRIQEWIRGEAEAAAGDPIFLEFDADRSATGAGGRERWSLRS